jgi:hypothetical protein
MKLSIKKLLSKLPIKYVLHNRVLLYVLCFIALNNIVMYASVKDFNSVITLLLIGILSSFFSKNMIVILALAIGITYLLNYNNTKLFSEGAQNMKEAVDGDDTVDKPVLGDDADNKSVIDAADEPTADESTSANDIATAATAAASEVDNNTAESESKERAKLTSEIKKDFAAFEKTAASITKSMQDIEPLLEKAEGFIQKYEKYSKM